MFGYVWSFSVPLNKFLFREKSKQFIVNSLTAITFVWSETTFQIYMENFFLNHRHSFVARFLFLLHNTWSFVQKVFFSRMHFIDVYLCIDRRDCVQFLIDSHLLCSNHMSWTFAHWTSTSITEKESKEININLLLIAYILDNGFVW